MMGHEGERIGPRTEDHARCTRAKSFGIWRRKRRRTGHGELLDETGEGTPGVDRTHMDEAFVDAAGEIEERVAADRFSGMIAGNGYRERISANGLGKRIRIPDGDGRKMRGRGAQLGSG